MLVDLPDLEDVSSRDSSKIPVRSRGRKSWASGPVEVFLRSNLTLYTKDIAANKSKAQPFYTNVTKKLLRVYGWTCLVEKLLEKGVTLELLSDRKGEPYPFSRRCHILTDNIRRPS